MILADLMGGTLCNTAAAYYLMNDRVTIIAGMNFPLALTALLSEDTAVNDLIQAGKDSMFDVKAAMLSVHMEDDE
nr:hypothetical protein [Clostridium sp. WB02_MRS01]